jgi:putative transposase
MLTVKGAHCGPTIILLCVPWYVAYLLRDRQLEDMRQERGVSVDRSTINRRVLKYAPCGNRRGHHTPTGGPPGPAHIS